MWYSSLLFSNKIIITNNFITNFKNLWNYLILNNKFILTNEVNYKSVDDKKYRRYWEIEDSKDIFKGITRSELRKQAYKYILNRNINFKDLIDPIDKKIKFIKL